jgi:hypothetical protein
MSQYVDGLESPTKEDFEKAKSFIRKQTALFEDLDSADDWDSLQDVLYAANTIINFYKQTTKNEDITNLVHQLAQNLKDIREDLNGLKGRKRKRMNED